MNLLQQYIKYVGGGWLVGLGEVVLTIIFTEIFHWWFFYGYMLAAGIGVLTLFFFHKNITFNGSLYTFKRLACFFFFMIFMAGITIMGVYLLVENVHMNYVLAIILVGIVTSISGFAVNKNVLFKKIEHFREEVKKTVKRSVTHMKLRKRG